LGEKTHLPTTTHEKQTTNNPGQQKTNNHSTPTKKKNEGNHPVKLNSPLRSNDRCTGAPGKKHAKRREGDPATAVKKATKKKKAGMEKGNQK